MRSAVPLCMVANSRMVVLLPITVLLFSPLYYRSWLTMPITAPGKILQSEPIMVSG